MLRGEWKKLLGYCTGCAAWSGIVEHRNCPKSGWSWNKPGELWIDINGFRIGCDKCYETWPPETHRVWCPLAHRTETRYSDTALVIARDDRILASDGNVVYVLRRSGVLVIGRRDYYNIGYRE